MFTLWTLYMSILFYTFYTLVNAGGITDMFILYCATFLFTSIYAVCATFAWFATSSFLLGPAPRPIFAPIFWFMILFMFYAADKIYLSSVFLLWGGIFVLPLTLFILEGLWIYTNNKVKIFIASSIGSLFVI